MNYTKDIKTPLGVMHAVSDGDAITALYFDGQKHKEIPSAEGTLPLFSELEAWLCDYFLGKMPEADLPLNPSGTKFQNMVWDILQGIPYGSSTSYGAVAEEICNRTGKKRMSAQAVGQAVGANPIAILIPCHRVLGKCGEITGYAGGLDRKEYLLKLEKTACRQN